MPGQTILHLPALVAPLPCWLGGVAALQVGLTETNLVSSLDGWVVSRQRL